MTRKDYVKLALALRGASPGVLDTREHKAWQDACAAVADVLQGDNERFNRMRFLDACGWNYGTLPTLEQR